MLGIGSVILRGHCQLLEAHENLAVHHANDVAVLNVHILDHLARELRGVGENLLFEQLARLPDGEACDIGLTGSVGAETRGRDVRILAGDDMHVAVAGKTHNLRRHLGVRGVCALPDFGFAALHGDRTVEVQLHTVRRRFQRNRVDRRVVPECCHADAAADRSGLVLIFFELPVVVNCRTTLFHALAERVIVVDVVREAVFKTLGHDEFVAVLDRIHTHGKRALFNVCIVCKRRLRHAVAAHCACCGAVGVDRVGIAFKVFARIDLRERAHRLGDDRVTMRGVGALVGEALDLARGNRAVLVQPRDDVEPYGVAHAVGDEGLLARAVDADAVSAHLRGAPGAKRLVQRVLLVAEAAADIRLDDLNVRPGSSQRLRDNAADDVRNLCRGNDGNASVFTIGEATVVFDVAVLDHRGFVPALDFNQPRLFDRFVVIALCHGRVLEDVAGALFVNLRCVRLHRLLHVQHERQHVILDLERAHALHGRDLVFRNDDGDLVSVVAHMPV